MKRKVPRDEIGNRLHMGGIVKNELQALKRSIAWLADEIMHDSSNLRKQLESPYIPYKWLYEISIALNKDFFSLYSKYLDNERRP